MQLKAGRKFERLFREAGIERHAVIDLQRPRVDGRSAPHFDADRVVMAKGEMLALRQVLGAFDFALISRVIGSGRDLAEDAANEADRRYLAHRIRDGLKMMSLRFTYTDLPADEMTLR